jgi:hypothetical protein
MTSMPRVDARLYNANAVPPVVLTLPRKVTGPRQRRRRRTPVQNALSVPLGRRASIIRTTAIGALVLVLAVGGQGCGRWEMARDLSSGPVEFTREDWSYGRARGSMLTSQHYVLYTTCTSKPFVDAMPGFLETCWKAYTQLLPPGRLLDHRLETYKCIRSGGYSERGITVSHYGGRRATLSVVAHEGLHQYLEATRGPHVPAWLNEGLACYFEAFDLDGRTNRPVFKPGTNHLRTRSLRETLVSGGLIPLEEILATHAGAEVQKQSSRVRSYYAQEWSLVLFLMRPERHNPYRQGFLDLLRELGSDLMDRRARGFLAADVDGRMSYGEAVFRAYVSDDLETFGQQYEAYLLELLHLER